MSFYVLNEYLHAYNRADYRNLYSEFKEVMTPEEFAATVAANEAVMNGDLSYEEMEKHFKEGFLGAIIKLIKELIKKEKEEGKKYEELMKTIEERITGTQNQKENEVEVKSEEKELGLGQPKRKAKTFSGPGF